MSYLNFEEGITTLCKNARVSSTEIAFLSNETRNTLLKNIAHAILENQDRILQANQEDIKALDSSINNAFIDRLKLNKERLEGMASSLNVIAKLPDPLNKTLSDGRQQNGCNIRKVTTPIGVIGVIYESRPNVTIDVAALCIKSGNVAILKTGKESFRSAKVLVEVIQDVLKTSKINKSIVQLVPFTKREAVNFLLQQNNYIDLIIPRGGKGLCKAVKEHSTIPTLLHLDGNCHIYVHSECDINQAIKVIVNAKMRRTGICGAVESLLIDERLPRDHLLKIIFALQGSNCKIFAEESIAKLNNNIFIASDEDYAKEYLSAEISMKYVNNVDVAIEHINHYGSHHTDSIITSNTEIAKRFCQGVDSAIVMHNTSTQFADGGEFGMGAEVGIATGKLHARGPVSIQELTTYKYIVTSDGACRK